MAERLSASAVVHDLNSINVETFRTTGQSSMLTVAASHFL